MADPKGSAATATADPEPKLPDWINPATKRKWDEALPGGVYVDGKTGRVHDSEGRPLDREALLAQGVKFPPLPTRPGPVAEPVGEPEGGADLTDATQARARRRD